MVLLNRSAWLYFCGWYIVLIRCLTLSSTHTTAKNLLTSCVPLLVKRYADMPYGVSQWSTKWFAMRVAVNFNIETALVYLE